MVGQFVVKNVFMVSKYIKTSQLNASCDVYCDNLKFRGGQFVIKSKFRGGQFVMLGGSICDKNLCK